MEASKQELEIIFDSITAMIFYKDKGNRFIRVNNALADATGKSKKEIEGKTAFEVFPEQAEDYWEDDKEVISSGKPKRNIIESFETAGGLAWVRTDKVPYRDTNGRIVGIIGFSEDITERKRIEEILKKRQSEIEELNVHLEHRVQDELAASRHKDHILIQQSRLAALGEMIGHIAHQWRQPLNILNLILINIKDAYDYQELDESYLDKSVTKGKQLITKMSTTIDDFRNFFLPNKEKEEFSLTEIVENTLSLVEGSIKYHHILVKTEINDDMYILGFASEFSQVILNLLNNAKDAVIGNNVEKRKISIKRYRDS